MVLPEHREIRCVLCHVLLPVSVLQCMLLALTLASFWSCRLTSMSGPVCRARMFGCGLLTGGLAYWFVWCSSCGCPNWKSARRHAGGWLHGCDCAYLKEWGANLEGFPL